jgi:predicted ATPase
LSNLGLVGKSLVAAERGEDGTLYRLLDTVRYYTADRHAAAFVGLAERERQLAVLAREQDKFRAALEWSLARSDPAGPQRPDVGDAQTVWRSYGGLRGVADPV